MRPKKYAASDGFLIPCAIIGFVIIFLTARYATRVWDDGFNYISPARSLINGDGLLDYNGGPYVRWAPLYPTLLALAGFVFNQDPLIPAYFINALIFGLIVYCGGRLSFQYLSPSLAFTICGTLAILLSLPLFEVSTQAWSEPLFIFFVLLGLRFAISYASTTDTKSLIFLSLAVTLACFQRYVGISLIIWSGLIVLIFSRGGIAGRLAHLTLFALLSAVPLGAWFVRNAIVAGGALATREPPRFTILENLGMAGQSIIRWYGAGFIIEPVVGIALCALAIGALAVIREWPGRDSSSAERDSLVFLITSGLLCICFISFVVTACAFTQCLSSGDNSRTFSPIYVPLALLLLSVAQQLGARYLSVFRRNVLSVILVVSVMVWSYYAIRANWLYATDLIQGAQRIGTPAWRHSDTIQYLLRHHNRDLKCKVYTNDVMSTFVLARVSADKSLNQLEGGGEGDISKLVGLFPPEDKACLVWYDRPSGLDWFPEGLGYLGFQAVQQVADTKLIVRLEDSAIYWMTRK